LADWADENRMDNMLKARVLSAVIGIPLLLTILYAGGFYWKALFFVLGILALKEFFDMMKNASYTPLVLPAYALFLTLLFSHLYNACFLAVLFLILLFSVIYYVLKYPAVSILDLSLSFLIAAYAGFLLNYAIRIADLTQAFTIILLVFILTWSSDIGGYFVGKKWGKNKMAPLLSPAKSWEGAGGSVLFSVLGCFIFFHTIAIENPGSAYLLLLAIISSVVAQFGDLFISGAKRFFKVKDSGRLIPGHGGVLDRFDSFLLVLPLVYFFFSM